MGIDRRLLGYVFVLLTVPLYAAESEHRLPFSPPPPFGPYMSSRQLLPPLDQSDQALNEPAWSAWFPHSSGRPYSGPGRYWAPSPSEQMPHNQPWWGRSSSEDPASAVAPVTSERPN